MHIITYNHSNDTTIMFIIILFTIVSISFLLLFVIIIIIIIITIRYDPRRGASPPSAARAKLRALMKFGDRCPQADPKPQTQNPKP